MNSHSHEPDGCLSALHLVAWAVLGGATAVVLFFVGILGAGEVFGGTEVGNGRVPGVGMLWWVFFWGMIPVGILGAVAAPLIKRRLPSYAQRAFEVLGVLSLIAIVLFVIFVVNS